ncbi:CtrA inhibitor SciP [Meridianimarinicoccus aquatilis]|uniref:DUF1153 domain-containing protein n=1 Tax=Meridianimarinicoccus aquatilis TaxID=2552766 RepID=A0A4R6AS93_9RHOB|nr:DUF1153 domain-containing protein [Fluviibacterium aquatile]QIE41597.1 DUF1153 domain-containing protein [Rhodobacteraceae bacterium SC52]TDL86344.1 DUF1153 domain-containing protein [Fluviibacterium aquatile]
MYLKKIDGPRIVTLPDGSCLSRADLPSEKTVRWVASRKAVVVNAVKYGLLPQEEALTRYGLSRDEFNSWCNSVERFGEDALKTTSLQKYRQL